jgi:hypothetical protein
MRDLLKERAPHNGDSAEDLAAAVVGDLPAPDAAPALDVTPPSRALREAQQDRNLAAIAGLMMRAAQVLDPITRIVVSRVLAVLVLVAAAGLCVFTVHLTQGWERVATFAVFVAFTGWLIRRAGV